MRSFSFGFLLFLSILFECHVTRVLPLTTSLSFSHHILISQGLLSGNFSQGAAWVLWEKSPEMKLSPEKMQQFKQVKQTQPRNPMDLCGEGAAWLKTAKCLQLHVNLCQAQSEKAK